MDHGKISWVSQTSPTCAGGQGVGAGSTCAWITTACFQMPGQSSAQDLISLLKYSLMLLWWRCLYQPVPVTPCSLHQHPGPASALPFCWVGSCFLLSAVMSLVAFPSPTAERTLGALLNHPDVIRMGLWPGQCWGRAGAGVAVRLVNWPKKGRDLCRWDVGGPLGIHGLER